MLRQDLTDYDQVLIAHGRSAVTDAKEGGGLSLLTGDQIASQVALQTLRKHKIPPQLFSFGEAGYVVDDPEAGQAPETQAFRNAGMPWDFAISKHSKVCGTGLKVSQAACDHIALKRVTDERPLTMGLCWEKMFKNGSVMFPTFRGPKAVDPTTFKGLTDPFTGDSMGRYGAMIGNHFGLDAAWCDRYAAECREFTLKGLEQLFPQEIVPVQHRAFREEPRIILLDDGPQNIKRRSDGSFDLGKPKRQFMTGSPLANSSCSTLNDGAWAGIFGPGYFVRNNPSFPAEAAILDYMEVASFPHYFPAMPVECVAKLLTKRGLSVEQCLFFVNEAFAVVPGAVMKALNIPRQQMNPFGGALCIGHPLGMSGGRILGEAAIAMRLLGYKYAIVCACIGSGQAIAILIETIE